jgi:syntaxin-binding protein 1
MTQFEKQQLAVLAGMEQNLATGLDPEGSEVKNPLSDMIAILNKPDISPQNKLRLALVYLISRNGLDESERRKILEAAGMSPAEAVALNNMAFLGVQLQKDKSSLKKKKKNKKSDSTYELSRFVPPIKTLMEEFYSGNLDSSQYPFVKAGEEEAPVAKKVTSLRRFSRTHPAPSPPGRVRVQSRTRRRSRIPV